MAFYTNNPLPFHEHPKCLRACIYLILSLREWLMYSLGGLALEALDGEYAVWKVRRHISHPKFSRHNYFRLFCCAYFWLPSSPSPLLPHVMPSLQVTMPKRWYFTKLLLFLSEREIERVLLWIFITIVFKI